MNTSGKTLSYGEQKDLERRIQDIKDSKGGKELIQGVNLSAPNVQIMDRQLKNLQSQLDSQGVGEVSDAEKANMEKECRLIEEKIRNGFPGYKMPSWDLYVGSRPKDGPRHDKIVAWIVWFNSNPTVQQLVRRWKTLRRHLDPHNPKASHVMYLFPE